MKGDASAVAGSSFELAQVKDRQVLKLSGSWQLTDGISSAERLFAATERAVKPGRLEVDASSLADWE